MISKKIDNVGRIVIPAEMRFALNWNIGDPILLDIQENRLVLSKRINEQCKICGSIQHLKYYKKINSYLCKTCREAISHEQK